MRTVFQLSPGQPDFQTRRQIELLSTAVEKSFAMKTHVICGGEAWLAQARAMMRINRDDVRASDVVHAWGDGALTVAVLRGARRVLYSPVEFPTLKSVRWLRALMNYRDVHVVCPTATMRRAFAQRGVPTERCHLIRPAVDFSKVRRRRDSELRTSLGFAESDVVLLAAGESTRGAGHAAAVWAAGILNQIDPKYRVLLWGQGPFARQVERFADGACGAGFATIAQDRLGRRLDFEELLPAVDIVLVAATAPVPTLPLATCMAAALPIVAMVTYTVAELLEDRHTALMVSRQKPKDLARRVLDLLDDSSLQWSISDMARTEAFEFFAVSRFNQQWRAVYEQVAEGEKVEVPETAPGAGLRFHGRA